MKIKILLISLLALSVLVNIFLVVIGLKSVKEIKYEIPSDEMQLIRRIAIACGTNEAKAKQMSANEMLSDAEAFIKGAESCDAAVFTKEELTLLDSYLNDQKMMLDKVKRQNAFVESLKGQRFLICPAKEQ